MPLVVTGVVAGQAPCAVKAPSESPAGKSCVGQCRSPQWRRREPRSGSVPGRTLWRGGGCLAERGAKARVAGDRVAAPGTLRLARLGTLGPLAGTLVARLGSVGRRPNTTRTDPTARGALTARVPRGTDSDGASPTAARLQPWGTDLGLTACVPRGTDSDGAHLTAMRLLTARVGVLTWNRRPQAMPGRGLRTCGRGPRAAPMQATPGRARWQSPRAPGPGTLEVAHWPSPAGAGWRPEPLEGSVRFARCGSLLTSGWSRAVSRPRTNSRTTIRRCDILAIFGSN